MTDQENIFNKSKYAVSDGSAIDHFDDFQAADSSINLEFASVESDERETYCSEESNSKKADHFDMYRSLQDDFILAGRDSPVAIADKYSTPKHYAAKSSYLNTSIRIYDASPVETVEIAREDAFYTEDDFDRSLKISSLAFPTAFSDVKPSQISSAEEIGRLENVLKRWQATTSDDDGNEEIASPSHIVANDDLMRKSPSARFDESAFPTFQEISFQDAISACLGVTIQPSHYTASAVLRHTTGSSFACCVTAPANDSRAATDRALVFAVADWRYSETLPVHWQTLATIYSKLTGEMNNIYRYGSHWEKIGFQGSDPITDLRAAGYLGLLHLLFLSTQATALAQQCYSLSINPQGHFPLAITGLNLTKMVMGAIRSGRLKVDKKNGASSAGRNSVASDRFLVASCKLYVALWQNYASIWSARRCTIHNSHEVLQKLEKLASKQTNQLLKKSATALNGSFLLQQRIEMCGPVAEENNKRFSTSISLTKNADVRSSKNYGKPAQAVDDNIGYTDISQL